MVDYVIEMNDIQKNFGEIQAVKDGQFNLRPGEIHSLIGENGAGKSTMMKLLYGMYPHDSGDIIVRGQVQKDLTPRKAIDMGIGMVHQEFMLVNELTVLENIILGFEPCKGGAIDFPAATKEIRKYIDQYHLNVQLNKKIIDIPIGEAQRVEIIKTLFRGAEILILDEPTAVLTPQETVQLFEILNELRKDGKSIIFISHKLQEVMEISDRITVMRQGEFVGTVNKDETNTAELARMMVGRDVLLDVSREVAKVGENVLEIDNLWCPGVRELSKIRGLSLNVRKGEIVGIAGIDGNGQTELVEAITGLIPVEKGEIFINGKKAGNKSPRKIRSMGLGHIPEDRNVRGLNRKATIKANLIADDFRENFTKGFVLDKKHIEDFANTMIDRFDIRPANPDLPTSAMSGGNAQKVVVAREVAGENDLLIACQPTRGVDIGAIESIRNILNEEKKKGAGILLVSAELDEIISLSDRILVMYEGRITGEMTAEEATREEIGMLMMGGTDKTKEVIA